MKRIVLAGCGSISRAWLKAASIFDDVQIVGLVDLRHEAIEEKIDQFNLSPKKTGDDLSEIIIETKPDLVFDCTVPAAHASVVTTAMELGCDVFGEKPMADTMDNALRMEETARRTGRTYAVMQNRRYTSGIRSFRSVVHDGPVGNLTTLNADFYVGAHFEGFRAEMPHVLLLDMAIHSFDQARYISGADPVSVYCHDWNPSGSWYADGASAAAIFEMSDGLVFNYRGSWCSEGLNTSWECHWRAIAEHGSIMWDGNDRIEGEKVASDSGFFREMEPISVPELESPGINGHQAAIRDFLDALDDGRSPLTNCHDNIRSVAMVHGAIESAESGCRVPLTQYSEL